ncbi:hypothetical protein GQ457_06G040830 [Hibiscus cannabinus]
MVKFVLLLLNPIRSVEIGWLEFKQDRFLKPVGELAARNTNLMVKCLNLCCLVYPKSYMIRHSLPDAPRQLT